MAMVQLPLEPLHLLHTPLRPPYLLHTPLPAQAIAAYAFALYAPETLARMQANNVS